VKPLPYSTQWIDDDDVEAVTQALKSDWLTTGPAVADFERALTEITNARNAIAVNSGTAALHTAYAAAGLAAGDEIVCPPLTFVATASAALMQGASVKFADVDPVTGNIDVDHALALAGARCKLITAVDYAGQPANYDALREACAASGLKIVADAAHSLGGSYHGRPVGTLADLTTLSFHPVKTITTGEGGAVLTNSTDMAESARRFRNHGIVNDAPSNDHNHPAWYYQIQSLGMNYRIPDILCALGISQLKKLESFIARRREIAAYYQAAFADLDSIETPTQIEGIESSWHLYVLRVRDASRRDIFFEALRADGIHAQLHYIPVHLHPLFTELGYREGLCPHAESYAARALSIPLYPRMSQADAERVVEVVTRTAQATL